MDKSTFDIGGGLRGKDRYATKRPPKVIGHYAHEAMRTICCAYKDVDEDLDFDVRTGRIAFLVGLRMLWGIFGRAY